MVGWGAGGAGARGEAGAAWEGAWDAVVGGGVEGV